MTVSNQNMRNTYEGNGESVDFPYTFMLTEADGVEVYVDGKLMSLNSDYSVSDLNKNEGGIITFNEAPASGATIQFFRSTPATQDVDYISNDRFQSDSHERALDKLTLLVQELRDAVRRSIKISKFVEVEEGPELPDENLPGKMMAFDENGNIIMVSIAAVQGIHSLVLGFNGHPPPLSSDFIPIPVDLRVPKTSEISFGAASCLHPPDEEIILYLAYDSPEDVESGESGPNVGTVTFAGDSRIGVINIPEGVDMKQGGRLRLYSETEVNNFADPRVVITCILEG